MDHPPVTVVLPAVIEATTANFPGRQAVLDGYGFIGRETPADIQHEYVGKRIPDDYRKRGAANPIKYAQRR